MTDEVSDGQGRKKRSPPAPDNTPKQCIGLQIEGYHVGSWCPTSDGSGPPEAVVIGLKLRDFEHELLLRLKSPERVDELIQLLLRHKRDVWPNSR